MRSCESVRKAIERVFGILKKRFRILKIPLPCYHLSQIVDIVHSCCILHNMILEDKDRINIGHLVDDWIDKGPDASKATRTLYDKANGRAYLLNGRAYMINDKTDYMLRGKQSKLPDWCESVVYFLFSQINALSSKAVRLKLTAHTPAGLAGLSCVS